MLLYFGCYLISRYLMCALDNVEANIVINCLPQTMERTKLAAFT